MKLSVLRGLMFLVMCAVLLSLATAPAFAATFTVTISFDENCQGSLANSTGFLAALPCGPVTDPGPGGLPNALFYGMLNPPQLVAGDVFILEPGTEILSDILRFDPNVQGGGVFVYSDILDGGGDLADIGFPLSFYTNTVTIVEVGPEDNNGVSYTPTAGQPGFVAGSAGPVTYNFTSDVPEPAAGLLLLAPLAAFVLRRRKQTA